MTTETVRPLALILKQIAILHSCQVNIVFVTPASDKQSLGDSDVQPLNDHGNSQIPDNDPKADSDPGPQQGLPSGKYLYL